MECLYFTIFWMYFPQMFCFWTLPNLKRKNYTQKQFPLNSEFKENIWREYFAERTTPKLYFYLTNYPKVQYLLLSCSINQSVDYCWPSNILLYKYLFFLLCHYSKYFGLIVCILGKAIMSKQDCISSEI